mmetsp:Transcript_12391/g.37354  ORF Transcript_12391/g.37354 Transcript_12391/m.37354 type:complete len:221 (-) Transcript_12391:1155-1817(-)
MAEAAEEERCACGSAELSREPSHGAAATGSHGDGAADAGVALSAGLVTRPDASGDETMRSGEASAGCAALPAAAATAARAAIASSVADSCCVQPASAAAARTAPLISRSASVAAPAVTAASAAANGGGGSCVSTDELRPARGDGSAEEGPSSDAHALDERRKMPLEVAPRGVQEGPPAGLLPPLPLADGFSLSEWRVEARSKEDLRSPTLCVSRASSEAI